MPNVTWGLPQLIPSTAAAAFDPSTGFPWNGDPVQDRATGPVWYDPTEQAWAVGPPRNVERLTAWQDEGHFPDQTVRWYDPSEQAWAVGPPRNAESLTAWAESQPDVAQAISYDPTDQPWAIGPPLNVGQLSSWAESQPDPAASPTHDPTDQSWAVQAPAGAAFDPSAGFPWTIEGHLPDQARRDYDGIDASLGLLPPTDPALLAGLWQGDDGQQDRSLQPTWNDPTTDGTLGQPPVNVVQLSAWTIEDHLPDQTRREYDGIDAAFGGPPISVGVFDPSAGFPWTVEDSHQAVSLQPVYWDGADKALGLVPPTDPALLAGLWNGGDRQQDVSLQPVWWDPTDQPWALGPPVTVANFAPFLYAGDSSQDRSVEPRWYDVTTDGTWSIAGSFAVSVVTGGRGPDSGGAYSATPSGTAEAPVPGGNASSPMPSGSASNPTPQR